MNSPKQELVLGDVPRAQQIAELNDQLRVNGSGGWIMVSRGVRALTGPDLSELLAALAAFDDFDEDCDPYGERDFGTFEFGDSELMWKIDYYGDSEFRVGSRDPANPHITWRVLTVLLISEY